MTLIPVFILHKKPFLMILIIRTNVIGIIVIYFFNLGFFLTTITSMKAGTMGIATHVGK